jgi:hypothetical protein
LPNADRVLFEGVRSGAAFKRVVADMPVASREVRCTSEYCLQHSYEPIGSLATGQSGCFQSICVGMPCYRPPYSYEFGFILSCASSSSEYVTAPFPHTTRGPCAPPMRFCSPSRHQRVKSTYWQVSTPTLCSAHSVSHALDGLLLAALCKLISSCSHVRDSLFRGSLPLPSHHGSSPCCPLVLLNDVRLQLSCPNCPVPAIPTSGF